MSCTSPLEPGLLADYWTALLPEAEVESVEEHLLACDECGERLRHVMALVNGVRAVARQGTIRLVVSDAFVRRGMEEGLRVRQYELSAGGSVHCTVTEDDDWLISRLTADLGASTRVDMSLCDASGVERLRLKDVPIGEGRRDVVYQESMAFAKASGTQTLHVRLIDVGKDGERVLAEYDFHHTRSLPGPGLQL